MLVSSVKFEGKAEEVLKEKLDKAPKHIKLEKKMGGSAHTSVTLEGPEDDKGGMMLYTSGTTNRPVCYTPNARFLRERSMRLIYENRKESSSLDQ